MDGVCAVPAAAVTLRPAAPSVSSAASTCGKWCNVEHLGVDGVCAVAAEAVAAAPSRRLCVTTKTRHLDRPGQLSEVEPESNTDARPCNSVTDTECHSDWAGAVPGAESQHQQGVGAGETEGAGSL